MSCIAWPPMAFREMEYGHGQQVALADLEKIGVLGSGSGGKVCNVRHRWTGKDLYALKVIQEKHSELGSRRQIMLEISILRTANSQHLVECYSVFDRGGEISFVLEYMDGGTLADVLKYDKKIGERHLTEVAKQVLLGLLYLHKQEEEELRTPEGAGVNIVFVHSNH